MSEWVKGWFGLEERLGMLKDRFEVGFLMKEHKEGGGENGND